MKVLFVIVVSLLLAVTTATTASAFGDDNYSFLQLMKNDDVPKELTHAPDDHDMDMFTQIEELHPVDPDDLASLDEDALSVPEEGDDREAPDSIASMKAKLDKLRKSLANVEAGNNDASMDLSSSTSGSSGAGDKQKQHNTDKSTKKPHASSSSPVIDQVQSAAVAEPEAQATQPASSSQQPQEQEQAGGLHPTNVVYVDQNPVIDSDKEDQTNRVVEANNDVSSKNVNVNGGVAPQEHHLHQGAMKVVYDNGNVNPITTDHL